MLDVLPSPFKDGMDVLAMIADRKGHRNHHSAWKTNTAFMEALQISENLPLGPLLITL